MKRRNKKLITFMLAGACVASLGVASTNIVASAETEAKTYKVDSVFSASATLGMQKVGEKNITAYTFTNGQTVSIKRDLALKWYTDTDDDGNGEVQYLSTTFSFADLNFKTMTFEIESSSSVATEDEKVSNAVRFSVEGGKVYAAVVHGEGDKQVVGDKKEMTIAANDEVTVKLTESADTAFDEFAVQVNGTDIGKFIQIGANYADYSVGKMEPLKITADVEGENKTTMLLRDLNGQKFDNVTKDGDSYMVADTAAPVLVVNEEISGFQFGTVFTLNYEKIDVLKSSSLSETKKYYQYNPADTGFVADFEKSDSSYKTLTSSSTYFMDTVYYTNGTEFSKEKKEGYTAKSVIKETGNEYVSIKIKLDDESKSMIYDLAWYANAGAVQAPTLGGETANTAKYIVVNQNAEGPTYSHIKLDDTNAKNVPVDGFDATAWARELTEYQTLVNNEAADKVSGSSEKLTIPAIDWLIKDNGGYRAMKFTISYKTPSGSTKTATRVSYSGLQVTIDEEGTYEFRVLAVDAAGNTMKYYLDGELVEVTTSNVWDFDEKDVPTFTFTIKNSPIEISETSSSSSSRKVEKTLDQTYTLSGLKVVGAKDEKSEYALYRLDTTNYTGKEITEDALISVSYKEIREAANEKIKEGVVGEGKTFATYFDLYLDVYAEKVAAKIGGDKAAVKACFVGIEEYNADNTESEDNKYNWKASSKSFTVAEQGKYLIMGDFWEDGLFLERAAAYKLIVVESKADVVDGESKIGEWIKKNLVSVILFGVAGLMLIAILILILVKPSDETLEDVEKKEEKKKAKKEKKEKKVKAEKTEETPVEETPVEETPVEETPVEETPVEETPVEETPVEETPTEETPVEETPTEETPVEATPVEETPTEKEKPDQE